MALIWYIFFFFAEMQNILNTGCFTHLDPFEMHNLKSKNFKFFKTKLFLIVNFRTFCVVKTKFKNIY